MQSQQGKLRRDIRHKIEGSLCYIDIFYVNKL